MTKARSPSEASKRWAQRGSCGGANYTLESAKAALSKDTGVNSTLGFGNHPGFHPMRQKKALLPK